MLPIVSKQEAIGWKQSYKLLKKKAMEQELSWSGLVVSLSIAFFVVAGSAGLLNLAYHSFEHKAQVKAFPDGEQLIKLGSLAQVFINKVEAATPDLRAAPAKKDTYYLNLTQNQTSTQTISFKNIGKDSWKPSEVSLETGPYLKTSSKLVSNAWLSFYRPVKLPREVKAGQTIDISFPVKAPAETGSMIQENFQLVRNEQPIKGSLIRVFITVKSSSPVTTPAPVVTQPSNQNLTPTPTPITPAQLCIASISSDPSAYSNCNTSLNEQNTSGITFKPILSAEPLLRIGLFTASNVQRISYDTLCDVIAGSETLFSAVGPNSVLSFSFDPASRRYAVVLGDISKTTASPLRFVPRSSSAVATLLDYSNGPAWNKTVSDNRFRNVIEIRYTEPAQKVWVINELPIESYIKGLAETTNASPLEFQKVMATAARSYALYHYLRGLQYGLSDASTKHSADHYHIDAYYDQVYRGYNSELRMPRLASAVDATRGVAVSYNGQPVVTPYFSNSDGRTRDWTEVWGGAIKPWLRSVLVPEDAGKTLFGHGVGMSARGALLQINAGKSWQDALKYFYTGIELIKIY